MELFGETIGTIILVVLVAGMLYGFYWILKYMMDGIRKDND